MERRRTASCVRASHSVGIFSRRCEFDDEEDYEGSNHEECEFVFVTHCEKYLQAMMTSPMRTLTAIAISKPGISGAPELSSLSGSLGGFKGADLSQLGS